MTDLDDVADSLPAHYFDCGRWNVSHAGRQDPCDCTATQDMYALVRELRAAREATS